jgi:hypothetical protein
MPALDKATTVRHRGPPECLITDAYPVIDGKKAEIRLLPKYSTRQVNASSPILHIKIQ